MANAKRCDICGKYYDAPEVDHCHIYDDHRYTSMVHVIRRGSEDSSIYHGIMQFDSCEDCLQDVIDYILTRRAEWEKGE